MPERLRRPQTEGARGGERPGALVSFASRLGVFFCSLSRGVSNVADDRAGGQDASWGPHAATSAFTGAALDDDLTRIGAIDDPNHHSALFWEHGQDRGSYLLIAGAGAPPVPVNETNLSKLAMGGKVHLGDLLERVRSIFGKATALRLTSLSSCAFPHAAAYAAATVYGPPHRPRIPAAAAMCRETGPDIARGQTLGTIVFRANRVVVLIWNYEECSI